MMHEKIKKLRSNNNISQEELVKLMGISRPTLSQIELGERPLKDSEIDILASLFELPRSEFLAEEKIEVKTIDTTDPQAKLKNLVLYILSKCGQKTNVGEIVLNKLLYFCDFNYYELNFESISGATYIKYPKWPVVKDMDDVLAEMETDQLLKRFEAEYYGFKQKKAIPLIDADMSLFNWKEIEMVECVINAYSDKNGKWLTEFSHEDMPWKATKKIMEPIEYGLVFQRSPTYSVTTQDEL